MQIVDIHHSLDSAQFPDLKTLQARYGWNDHNQRVFQKLFELESAALHIDIALEETLRHSARQLANANPALVGQVDMLIYCHAVNDTMPFDTEALDRIAQEELGSSPEICSITMGSCASAIMALDFLKGLGPAAPENVVILTGEKCFFSLLDYIVNNGLNGEATSAVWLRPHGNEGMRIEAVRSGRFEGVWDPLGVANREVLAAYDRAYIPTLSQLVIKVLDAAECQPTDIDIVLPTHLSPFTFNRVSASVGIGPGRVLKQNLHRIGHCFCGDLFINIATFLQTPDRSAGACKLLSFAAGMTGSYAALVLTKEAAS